MTYDSLYDVNALLPKKKKQWFDVVENEITNNDTNLVNVAKFVGVDTIGSSMKNATLDIRGSPPCPKYNVSVWNNSSYDPDHNTRGITI